MSIEEKKFYNIDEIASLIDEPKHTIRFWESRFDFLKINRVDTNHRYYSYENLLILKKIKYLLQTQKYTLDGVINFFSSKDNRLNALNSKNIQDNLREIVDLLNK